jgi:hypothetical protein
MAITDFRLHPLLASLAQFAWAKVSVATSDSRELIHKTAARTAIKPVINCFIDLIRSLLGSCL